MLRKPTLLALVILAALVAFMIYLNQQKAKPAEAEPTATADSYVMFGSDQGMPNHITIESVSKGTVEISRQPDGSWMVMQPVAGAADASQAEAAATQISALRVLEQVDVAPGDAGLTQPAYKITVGFTGGIRHTLELGDQTPSMTGYYASLDTGPVVIVSSSGVEGLLGILDAPPYVETPTPSPLPATETPPVTTMGTLPAGDTGTPSVTDTLPAATGTP